MRDGREGGREEGSEWCRQSERSSIKFACSEERAHGIVADRAQCKDLTGIRIRGILIRITMLKAKKKPEKNSVNTYSSP